MTDCSAVTMFTVMGSMAFWPLEIGHDRPPAVTIDDG
jgi:hypothetical protein